MATTERTDTRMADATEARNDAIKAHRAALDRIHTLAGDRRQAPRPELWEMSDAAATGKLESKRTPTSPPTIRDALVAVDRTSHELYMAAADYDHTARALHRDESELTTVTINEREAGWLNRGEKD